MPNVEDDSTDENYETIKSNKGAAQQKKHAFKTKAVVEKREYSPVKKTVDFTFEARKISADAYNEDDEEFEDICHPDDAVKPNDQHFV